jgi:SnoaL-like polyketide cyclase
VTDKFRTRVNGGPWADAAAIAERGSYNILIGDNAYYAADQENFDSSHDIFHAAFPGGFFWEVLDVLSPPPVVSFKWRHWGRFEGDYQGFAANGKTIELFGVSIARCSDDLRLVEVEHFYDNSQFLSQLTGGCPLARKSASA